MSAIEKTSITVEAVVMSPIEKVWDCWTLPRHITQWNNASDDWHTPNAENDLQKGGKFLYRMEAKDGRFGFDFGGTYTTIKTNALIAYILDDGRKVQVKFSAIKGNTVVTEIFETENINSVELQKTGWQAILDNYKKYTEGLQ